MNSKSCGKVGLSEAEAFDQGFRRLPATGAKAKTAGNLALAPRHPKCRKSHSITFQRLLAGSKMLVIEKIGTVHAGP